MARRTRGKSDRRKAVPHPGKRRAAVLREAERRASVAREAAAERHRVEHLPTQRWHEALERCRTHLSIDREAVLKTVSGIKGTKLRGTPWALVGRISGWDGTMTYPKLWSGLAEIDRDKRIHKLIGDRRKTRISVIYEGPTERGGNRYDKREWTLAEIAPWAVTRARALERIDPGIEDSIGSRYSAGLRVTKVLALAIWISSEVAPSVAWDGDDEEA